jgi:putative ABC transport system ATP-binding protein
VVKPLVQLVDVVKVYDSGKQQRALDGVNLQLVAGELTAMMGPSGSGKSTLLNLVAGLDRPTSGSVVVDGVDLAALGEAGLALYRRQRLGFIFQFFNLLQHLTVIENVMMPAQLAGRRTAAAKARAQELLEQLGIRDRADEYPGRLSGGQQQAVAIARALVNEPILILADEPTGAVDSKSGEHVMNLLVDLNRQGQTILLVTHDPKVAARYARRVVSLLDGRVVDDAALQSSTAQFGDVVRMQREEPREQGQPSGAPQASPSAGTHRPRKRS